MACPIDAPVQPHRAGAPRDTMTRRLNPAPPTTRGRVPRAPLAGRATPRSRPARVAADSSLHGARRRSGPQPQFKVVEAIPAAAACHGRRNAPTAGARVQGDHGASEHGRSQGRGGHSCSASGGCGPRGRTGRGSARRALSATTSARFRRGRFGRGVKCPRRTILGTAEICTPRIFAASRTVIHSGNADFLSATTELHSIGYVLAAIAFNCLPALSRAPLLRSLKFTDA